MKDMNTSLLLLFSCFNEVIGKMIVSGLVLEVLCLDPFVTNLIEDLFPTID